MRESIPLSSMYILAFTFRTCYRDYIERGEGEGQRELIALVEIDIQRAISARPFHTKRASERERARERGEGDRSGRCIYRDDKRIECRSRWGETRATSRMQDVLCAEERALRLAYFIRCAADLVALTARTQVLRVTLRNVCPLNCGTNARRRALWRPRLAAKLASRRGIFFLIWSNVAHGMNSSFAAVTRVKRRRELVSWKHRTDMKAEKMRIGSTRAWWNKRKRNRIEKKHARYVYLSIKYFRILSIDVASIAERIKIHAPRPFWDNKKICSDQLAIDRTLIASRGKKKEQQRSIIRRKYHPEIKTIRRCNDDL